MRKSFGFLIIVFASAFCSEQIIAWGGDVWGGYNSILSGAVICNEVGTKYGRPSDRCTTRWLAFGGNIYFLKYREAQLGIGVSFIDQAFIELGGNETVHVRRLPILATVRYNLAEIPIFWNLGIGYTFPIIIDTGLVESMSFPVPAIGGALGYRKKFGSLGLEAGLRIHTYYISGTVFISGLVFEIAPFLGISQLF